VGSIPPIMLKHFYVRGKIRRSSAMSFLISAKVRLFRLIIGTRKGKRALGAKINNKTTTAFYRKINKANPDTSSCCSISLSLHHIGLVIPKRGK
jgi:hypothetical protein